MQDHPPLSLFDRAARRVAPLALLAIVATVAAQGGVSAPPGPVEKPSPHTGGSLTGPVLETMDSGGYTYARVAAGSDEVWAAGPATKLSTGEVVSIETVMPMRDFRSTTLNRTFPLVYFVQGFKGGAAAAAACPSCPGSAGGTVEAACAESSAAIPPHGMPEGHPVHPNVAAKPEGRIEGVAKADVTVAELHARRAEFAGRKVAVRGRVVKVNAGIMNRNWIHLQDGSGEGPAADLTVTSVEHTAAVGDVALATGVVAVDKDFGSGYRYDVIVEDATIAKE